MKRNSCVESSFIFLKGRRALIPFITLLYLFIPFKSFAQDVQVLLRAKMDPMPPQVMNYISNPATFFEVSLTNTTNEVQQVFLTLEIVKQTGDELSVSSPYYIQPSKPITLAPKKLTIANQLDLLNQFRQLNPQDVTLKGAEVSDFFDNGVVGLLPEGTYQAHMKVYKWDLSVKYPQLVSDPLQGKCTFSVCYSAAAPEILVPVYNSFELKSNAVGTPKPETPGVVSDANDAKWQPAILDPTKAQFVWKTPTLNCGGKTRSYKYQLDIYPIGTTMTTPEQAVAQGSVAKSVKNLVAAQCILSEAEVIQMKKFSATGYFVARVTATPTVVDKKNVDYSTVENDGHSQLLVFRLKQDAYGKGDKKDDKDKDEEVKEEKKDKDEEVKEEKKKDEEEKKDVDPGYKEPDKNSDKKFVYYPPKLIDPKSIKGHIFKEEEDIKFQWEKPTLKSGDNKELSFTYDVNVYKRKSGDDIETLLEKAEPVFAEKSLSATNYTLRWKDIKEKVQLKDNLVVAVMPVCTDESSIGYDYSDRRNALSGSYVTGETGKLIDCDPEAAKEITNRTLERFTERDMRSLEVTIGKFPLTITNANLVDNDHYAGKGFITWKPLEDGLPFMVNVTFDKLYINSDKVVYDGEVVSAKEEEKELNDYIPYDMFDELFLADLIGAGTAEAYGQKLMENIENNNKMANYCQYAREIAPILTDVIKQQVSVNLPVSLSKLIPTCPVDIQIMSGRWSATNASVSIVGMFSLPESDYLESEVCVFGLPRLCIEPNSFVPSGCTMALLTDFSIKDPKTNFIFDLKAPSDLQKMEDDGCTISFNNNGFQKMHFEADMEIPGLIKANEKGERLKGELPHIDIQADITDWDDWIGQITMDNFEVEEAPGFTFVPTGGGGLLYDHSPSKNAKGFSFPKTTEVKGGLEKDVKQLSYNKELLKIKKDEEWQGLYLNEIGVFLPPIFKDEDNRIKVSMKDFLWDNSGVSLAISAGGTNGDIVKAETGKLGGWGISLHEVGVSVVQNNFGCAYFNGMLKAPLIGGKWNYSTSFDKIDKGAGGSDLRILFHMQPDGDPEFDFLLAKVNLDEKYTHLDVQYLNATKETKVELEMAGHITIAGTEELTKNLDFNIPGIAFTGMRVANFEKPKDSNNQSDVQDMKFAQTVAPICEGPDCWFELGTWGLASAEKTLGPFKFSLDNFGVANKTVSIKGKDAKVFGLNIVGTIGLVSDVFSATAGVTIWAQVDLNKLDIDYYETTLDKIGLSTEFGGCKVAGELEFVDTEEDMGGQKRHVKGYSGSLKFELPGGLFHMDAAGGFFDVKEDKRRYTSAYFLAELGGATGIPIGPVQLNDIMGGFFFHSQLIMTPEEAKTLKDVTEWKKHIKIKYGTHGGMFGLGISTVGSDRGINAKVCLTVLYDAERNKLSTFRMTGEMNALCVASGDDGMIKANCCIVYQNLPENEGGKYFQINITVDAGGDMKELYKQFTGQELTLPDCTSGLESMSDSNPKKSSEPEVSASCGVNISLDFKITLKPDDCTNPNFKSKWHLYVGQPGDGSEASMKKDRCSITLIDFQVGKKTDPIAVWCKEWAAAYLCIGNELPNDGALPDIPQEIREFLDGKSNVNKDLKDSSKDRTGEVKAQQEKAKAQFEGMAKSGVMFGAAVGGNWGFNAAVCYADATLLAGFDIVLKQLDPDETCGGKPAGGKGGFYGTGQIYAMAKGEMGLMIDIWIYQGKWSLIDVGVGALLKGGFPNPSWMYGKLKARCNLFGGLIKWTGSLEMEMGEVCFPDMGNPLDDVKIFEDMTPGEEHTGSAKSTPDAWGENANKVSIYSPAGFTTNMKIDKALPLIDENRANRLAGREGDPADYALEAMRVYIFHLDPKGGTFEYWNSPSESGAHGTNVYTYSSKDQETFSYNIQGGRLEPNKYYKMTQTGYAKEIVNGVEVDPIFNDKKSNYKNVQRPWSDEIVYYFRTGPRPDELTNDVAFTLPQLAGFNRYYKNEMQHPQVHFKTDFSKYDDPTFDKNKYEYKARFEKQVWGQWVPADATIRVDTYKSGSNYYAVDEYGNVDYTTKVDANGNVLQAQCDPFTNYAKPTGVRLERLQRFTDRFYEIMIQASNVASAFDNEAVENNTTSYLLKDAYGNQIDRATQYYPVKWVPESFTSLRKEIEYYQTMMDEEKYYALRSKFSTIKEALTNLDKEVNSKQSATNPTDEDIRYVYPNAKTTSSLSYYKSQMTTKRTEFRRNYDTGGSITFAYNGVAVRRKNRHVLTPDEYVSYHSLMKTKNDNAYNTLKEAFNKAPCTQTMNEIKAIYLDISVPFDSIARERSAVLTIKNNLTTVKDRVRGQQSNMKYIRTANYSLYEKKKRLGYLESVQKTIADYRKKSEDLYLQYNLTKELGMVADEYNDSVTVLSQYITRLENRETVKSAVTTLESYLTKVNAYLDKTPEASRSYSYVKSNYYSNAKAEFEKAEKASGEGSSDFEKAKATFNAIEKAIFSSERIALDYAKEQKTTSNSKLTQARNAASAASSAASSTAGEQRKSSATNDNAKKINDLKAAEEKKYADAYNAANAVADIVSDVRRATAVHTSETNQSSAANQMRQIVKDCQANADAAMESYRKAVNTASGYRVKVFADNAVNAFYNMRGTIKQMMSKTNTTLLEDDYKTVQKYASAIDEAIASGNSIKSDHIYCYLMRDIKKLVDGHFKNAAYYLRYPNNSSYAGYVANYLHGASITARDFAASKDAALQDEEYADYMAKYAEEASAMLKTYADIRSESANSKYKTLQDYCNKVSNAFYNMRYYTGLMLTENSTTTLNNRFNSVKSLYDELKTIADKSKGIDDNHINYVQIKSDRYLASLYYNAALYLKERTGTNANFMVNVASNLCSAAEEAKKHAASTYTNEQDASYASHMATVAEDANKHIKGYTYKATLSSSQRTSVNSYKSKTATAATDARTAADNKKGKKYVSSSMASLYQDKVKEAADYAKKARSEANLKKGKHLTMEAAPTADSAAAPLYAVAQYRSTVPGVAEAFELMAPGTSGTSGTPGISEPPETPETPEGPAGAAVVAKVAGMMNASLPKPVAKPSVPASSVISSASSMLNGVPSGKAPDVPAVSGVTAVSGLPAASNPYSKSTSFLNNALSGKTTTVTANTAGTVAHLDTKSLSNTNTSTIPVRYVMLGNGTYQYLAVDCDMYSTVMKDPEWKSNNYRIMIYRVDKAKFKEAQIESKKDSTTTTMTATLDSQNQFLTSTGKDGADNTTDTYNLKAYMANYYKEMKEQGLDKNTAVEQQTKIDAKAATATLPSYTKDVYEWKIDFRDNYGYSSSVIYDDFATWAKNNVNADGSTVKNGYGYGGNMNYLDRQLEGIRPKKFTYVNSSYTPEYLAKKNDSQLDYCCYILKDPYVWLGYVAGRALFNGRGVSSKSSYWDYSYSSPEPMNISFASWTSAYRSTVEPPSVGFTNMGKAMIGKKTYYDPITKKWYQASKTYADEKDKSWTDEKGTWTATDYINYEEISKFIKQAAIGYTTPSYDRCRQENFVGTMQGKTAVDAIKSMLDDMYTFMKAFNSKYNLYFYNNSKYAKSSFNTVKNQKVGGDRIYCKGMQVAFVYQSKWLIDNSKGGYTDYFPGYPSRYHYSPDQVVLNIRDYSKTSTKDYRFDFKWYCNNLKSVTQEIYRCNVYNCRTGGAEHYSVYETSGFTYTKDWSYPLSKYADSYNSVTYVQPLWK